jgi:TRAP-type C4-dicarboxylate transport system permease small subunit
MRAVLRKAAEGFGVVLFGAMFCVFLIQIAARFAFNRPLAWTDELAVLLYLWVILWAAAFIVPEREHVAFDLLWNGAGPRTRRAMRIAGHVMLGGLCAWALPGTWDYVRFMAREGTPVLGVPFMVVFLPFVALLASIVVRCAWAVWQAARGKGTEDTALPR